MHTHAHSEVISPEGLPLALDRGSQGENVGSSSFTGQRDHNRREVRVSLVTTALAGGLGFPLNLVIVAPLDG